MTILSNNQSIRKAEGSEIGTKVTNSSEFVANQQILLKVKRFSFFKKPVTNSLPLKDITLRNAYDYIKGHYAEKQTNLLRSSKTDDDIKRTKRTMFDYCTFSGTFSCRKKDAIISYSGLLCLDFDDLPDVETAFEQLRDNQKYETQLLFRSPSGKGLKWVIQCNYEEHSHLEFFNEVCQYVSDAFDLIADPSGKDIGRACFLPHDENAYINPKLLKQ